MDDLIAVWPFLVGTTIGIAIGLMIYGKIRKAIAVVAIALFLILVQSEHNKIRGKIIKVIDGDTAVIQGLIWQRHVRLSHIDAPEKVQFFGDKSSQRLHEKIDGKYVAVVVAKGRDPHHRVLGEIYIGYRNINLEMVKEGMAWHYKRYSKSKEYAEAAARAQKAKIGLWRDRNPIEPEQFRRLRHRHMAS